MTRRPGPHGDAVRAGICSAPSIVVPAVWVAPTFADPLVFLVVFRQWEVSCVRSAQDFGLREDISPTMPTQGPGSDVAARLFGRRTSWTQLPALPLRIVQAGSRFDARPLNHPLRAFSFRCRIRSTTQMMSRATGLPGYNSRRRLCHLR